VAKRLLIATITLVGMSMVIFSLMRLAPGSIVDIIFESAGYVDQADKKLLEQELGVDKPIPVQYVRWIGELFQGELGKSYRYDMPAWTIIKPRLPVTLELATLALLFSILLGVPFGVISAARQNRPVDYVLRVLSLAGLSMPSFWLGMVIILVFVRSVGWIPSVTYVSPFEDLRANLWQFVVPALAVGYRSSALIMRITRSAMLEVMESEFVKLARIKGLSEGVVIWKHCLRNALIPVLTLWGVFVSNLITGAIVTETVFAWPGIGRLTYEAVIYRDFPLLQAVIILKSILILSINLGVDILYAYVDPRIRLA
jgi:peptide/nickel transport system permease protein